MRFPLRILESCTSTLDTIHEAGAADAPEGTTHIARMQERGRGRGNHVWQSPADAGLWMTTLLRPSRPVDTWGGLSLVMGTAVRRTLVRWGLEETELFWPNDVEYRGRKLCGILGEARTRGKKCWLALGIGLNLDLRPKAVRRKLPPEVRARATSLAECGLDPPPEARPLAVRILATFGRLYERFLAGAEIERLVDGELAHVGRSVEVRIPGHRAWSGVVQGLGHRGDLLLTLDRDWETPPPGARWHAKSDRIVALAGGEVVYE
jgi:BirA family biotin operon repressor/biotin-[acetyl-CoA-carboxylase] ligase